MKGAAARCKERSVSTLLASSIDCNWNTPVSTALSQPCCPQLLVEEDRFGRETSEPHLGTLASSCGTVRYLFRGYFRCSGFFYWAAASCLLFASHPEANIIFPPLPIAIACFLHFLCITFVFFSSSFVFTNCMDNMAF
jgi:hypothetical protein